ncbi:MAG: hypothetical protein NT094_00820, partial [Candidatus Staskawiczbacteria bacterium]|nr:hypothetical protein [Candidatus Staskawiczbacteria bacterium]
ACLDPILDTILATIFSPLMAGLIIYYFSFQTIFLIGSVILLISCLPLFLSEDCHSKINFTWKSIWKMLILRRNMGMVLSFTGYAIESSIGRGVWPIFLFVVLGTAQKVGYAASVSIFLTVFTIFATGKLADRFNPKKLLSFGTMLYFFGWVGCLFADSVTKIFFFNSYKGISERFLQLPWSSIFYKIINPETYFQMVVARDLIFNASRLLILPVVMVIFYINFYPFVISFVVAAAFTLLYPLLNNSFKSEDLEYLKN